jgi:hypothetical protein
LLKCFFPLLKLMGQADWAGFQMGCFHALLSRKIIKFFSHYRTAPANQAEAQFDIHYNKMLLFSKINFEKTTIENQWDVEG